ncbi:MAG: hypothetical protein DRQ62_05985, partial [Gammaproteobacteria bacterium]
GEGVLRLLAIQMPGKKRMQVADFLNAHHVSGLQLGQIESRPDGVFYCQAIKNAIRQKEAQVVDSANCSIA